MLNKNLELDHNKLNKTIALSSGEKINSIVNILKTYFNITHYCYIRSFPDGTHLLLSNDSRWIENFYLDFYKHGAFHKVPDLYYSGHVLWGTAEDQTTFNVCRENFNIDNGITIIEKQKKFCEFYCFGSTRDNPKIIDFYLHNLDLLARFNAFFKEQAYSLIEEANSDRWILPRCYSVSDEKVATNIVLDNIRSNFMQAIQCKRYYLQGIYSDVYLTARELDCLNLIALGKANKEVAKLLNISIRTVETHLNALKIKLEATCKTNLMTKSLQYNQYKPNSESQFISNLKIAK